MTDDEKYLAVIDRMISLEQALRRLLTYFDEEPCVGADDGVCGMHGFQSPCAVAVARTLLEPPPEVQP